MKDNHIVAFIYITQIFFQEKESRDLSEYISNCQDTAKFLFFSHYKKLRYEVPSQETEKLPTKILTIRITFGTVCMDSATLYSKFISTATLYIVRGGQRRPENHIVNIKRYFEPSLSSPHQPSTCDVEKGGRPTRTREP